MQLGVTRETDKGEYRVAITPEHVKTLVKKGAVVQVQSGAGAKSGFSDAMYEEAGAKVVGDEVWNCDVVTRVLHLLVVPYSDLHSQTQVRAPTKEMIDRVGNRTLLTQLGARVHPDLVDQVAAQKGTCLDLTMLLRTLSRGQSFDVLSSQVLDFFAVTLLKLQCRRMWLATALLSKLLPTCNDHSRGK